MFCNRSFALLLLLPLSGFLPTPGSGEVLSLEKGRHLFLDDSLVDPDLSTGIQRRMTPPTQIRRVLKPERAWEKLGFIFYSTVLDFEGVAMLYYGCYDGEKGKHLALATSRDGLTWTRPSLQLTPFDGETSTNLFPMEAVEAGVFLDPTAPPEKRFRLLHNRHWPDPDTAGIYLSNSPDGIHWKEHPVRLFPLVPDSQPSAFWDPDRKRYAIYLRAWDPRRAVARAEMINLEEPWGYDQSIAPFQVWGPDKVATISRELPIVMRTDERDPENVHLYTSAVVRYPWAHDTYLAFPAAYFHFQGEAFRRRALDGNDGTFDVQLAVSRDGIAWERFRQPWVEPDHLDGITLQLVSMGTGMIRRGRVLRQYFVGWPHTHNRPVEWDRNLEDRERWKGRDLGGIYCATFRLDGFVALAAGAEEGLFTSQPRILKGTRIWFNVDTSGTGSATVALLDPEGAVLPGYDHTDCDAIHADETRLPVTWKGEQQITVSGDQPIRIQVRMQNTRLWALELE